MSVNYLDIDPSMLCECGKTHKASLDKLFDTIGTPKTAKEIGVDDTNLGLVFKATKDIRDKYVLSRLVWDIGVIDDFANIL